MSLEGTGRPWWQRMEVMTCELRSRPPGLPHRQGLVKRDLSQDEEDSLRERVCWYAAWQRGAHRRSHH